MSAEREARPRPRAGTVLTDDEIERHADTAAGYDLTQARRVGRPPLGTIKPSPHVTFRAPAELAPSRRTRREGKTVSQLARKAFERCLAS